MTHACPRCGHDQVYDLSASERVKKLVPGLKPARAQCGVDTGEWACPCRSRFHVGARVSRAG